MMKCGHRGKPSRVEEKRISRLLRKSGFIPMLEDLYRNNNTSVHTGNRPSDKSMYDNGRMNSSKMTFNEQSMDGIKVNINLDIPTSRLFLQQNSSS